jgi:hypothetical protein
MMTCRACRLPAAEAAILSRSLAKGDPSRLIGAAVGLSEKSIRRHRRKCIGKALAVVVEAQRVEEAETFVEGIRNRIDDARRVGEKAEAIGDLRCALAAFKTMAEIAMQLEARIAASADTAEPVIVAFKFADAGALAAARAAGYEDRSTDTAPRLASPSQLRAHRATSRPSQSWS